MVPRHTPSPSSASDWAASAHELAYQLPPLLVEARRVAHTVAHGIHGRGRAGPGETFWQFRHYHESDTARLIDWRKSAGSDALFVREREWEAAHTVWFWPDRSASMNYRSRLSGTTKRDRAMVIALALSELLVQAGERVAVFGGPPPTTSRPGVRLMADWLAQETAQAETQASLPPPARLGRRSECILISDFLEPADEIAEMLGRIAGREIRGHLVQILDPAEETLPFEGRIEFAAPEEELTVLAGRAEALRERYRQRLEAHRGAVSDFARHLGWSFLVHHTDRPAEEPLLALHALLSGEKPLGPQSSWADSGGLRPGGPAP